MRDGRAAVLALTGVNVIWGSTFFLTKQSLDALAAATGAPVADTWAGFLLLRFVLAALLGALVFPTALPGLRSAALWRDAAWIALPTAAGFALQTAGLARVSPSASAFLTSLYVPLTPVAGWLLFRTRLPQGLLAPLILAVGGLWILTPPTAPGFGTGELLSAACGIAFAFQIVAMGRVGARHDARAMTLAMFLLIAALAALPGWAVASRALGRLEGPGLWAIVFNGTVASVLPFWVMCRFQHRLAAAHAAVVYAAEPVFAAALSAACFGERFGPAVYLGGGLVVAANVWAGLRATARPTAPPCPSPAGPL